MPNADLVLEGGGLKGIGLTGAVAALLRAGYAFPRAAGTSAGAIVEFDASARQRAAVVENGRVAAQEFLAGWDWEAFKRDCVPAHAG